MRNDAALIGGVLADRRDRRRTLLASQYVQMATATTLALLVVSASSQIWHILMLSFTTASPRRSAVRPTSRYSVARRQKDLPNAVAPQLDSIQRRARARPAGIRRHDCRLRNGRFTDAQAMAAASR